MLVPAQLDGQKRVRAEGQPVGTRLDLAPLQQPLVPARPLLCRLAWCELLDELATIHPGYVGHRARVVRYALELDEITFDQGLARVLLVDLGQEQIEGRDTDCLSSRLY